MKTCTCDLCKKDIKSKTGVCFSVSAINKGGIAIQFDFCDSCIEIVRKAVCKYCKGTGKFQEVDRDATDRQATCGESRTQYRTVSCHYCRRDN